MAKWRDVAAGDRVELGGRTLVVDKAKAKKSGRIAVTVSDKLGTFSSVVDPKDKVKLVAAPPLHASNGAQNRWAEEVESDRADEQRRVALPPGDPEQIKRPAKATGGPWDKPKGAAEKAIEEILGAHLVGESNDESAGYYVPPVDEQTIAAHSLIFHGSVLSLEQHAAAHAYIKSPGSPELKTNHWHTKERP